MSMTVTHITKDGKYLAQCRQCGAWVELQPETAQADLFFAMRQAEFSCCGLKQVANFTEEKDEIDFH